MAADEPMYDLTTYADAYLACREIGHAWQEDERTRKGSGGIGSISRVLACGRCPMVRIDSFNYRGELLTRTYRYPAGYHLAYRPAVAELRVQRFLNDGLLTAADVKKRQRKAADKSMDSPKPVKAPNNPTQAQAAPERRRRRARPLQAVAS